jgi:hypothetical protein
MNFPFYLLPSYSLLWKNHNQDQDTKRQTDSANFAIKLILEILPLCVIAKNENYILQGLIIIGIFLFTFYFSLLPALLL